MGFSNDVEVNLERKLTCEAHCISKNGGKILNILEEDGPDVSNSISCTLVVD